MMSPIVIALLCAFIMIPVSYACNRSTKSYREIEIGEPPEFKIVLLTKLAPSLLKLGESNCCRKIVPRSMWRPLSDVEKQVWLRTQRGFRKRYLAGVRLRKILVFLIYALYPSLVAGVMTIFNCEKIGHGWYVHSSFVP